MPELPIAAIERLIRNAPGAERVSPDAAVALRKVLEDYALEIAAKAAQAAKHAGRKTVTDEDIELVVRTR